MNFLADAENGLDRPEELSERQFELVLEGAEVLVDATEATRAPS